MGSTVISTKTLKYPITARKDQARNSRKEWVLAIEPMINMGVKISSPE
jgi:hypothetical protein